MTAHQDESRDDLVIILIADDETAIATMIAAVVEDAGYTAVVAAHGRHAFDLARERWPALLITDLMMPQMTGTELIAALRAHAAEHAYTPMPVILMTAAGMGAARVANADAVLLKPFDLDRLDALVHRLLSSAAS